jgi:hypothetical protein
MEEETLVAEEQADWKQISVPLGPEQTYGLIP